MDDFKGMYRDTTRSKTPPMMWEFARNILLSKGFTSVTNEDGFDFKCSIPGKCIGIISTNDHIVYFSVEETASYIGYTKKEDPTTYIPVLATSFLGFKANRPIEGIFFYNYKMELVVAWCDGIFDDSNTPKILNITNPNFEVDGYYEFVNPEDVTKLEMFNTGSEATINTSYSIGSLLLEVVYITYSYIDSAGNPLKYAPIVTVTYPKIGQRRHITRDVTVYLTNLDTKYNKLKIVLIGKLDNATFAYETDTRTYKGTSYTETFSTVTNLNEIAPADVVVPSIYYTRVNTMTMINNQAVLGNLKTAAPIKFQKYANLLRVGLKYDQRPVERQGDPILCPDEVYSLTIALQLLSGEYTEEFHIPNVIPASTEIADFSRAELDDLGLGDYTPSFPLKRFHIFNTGRFVNTSNGSFPLYTFPSWSLGNNDLIWGYWQNVETYPDDDSYDSSIDYDGNPIIGGEDLRNTPVRHHRVPGLDNLAIRCGINLGETPYGRGVPIGGLAYMYISPSFAVNILNFPEVVPADIIAQIQGFRLSISKRDLNTAIVKDINFVLPMKCQDLPTDIGDQDTFSVANYPYHSKPPGMGGQDFGLYYRDPDRHASQLKVLSPTLAINMPAITHAIVKANYAVSYEDAIGYNHGGSSSYVDTTLPTFSKGNITLKLALVPDAKRFATIKSLTYLPPNNTVVNNILQEESIRMIVNNTLDPVPPPVNPNPIYEWEHLGVASVPYDWNPLNMDANGALINIMFYNGISYATAPSTGNGVSYMINTTIIAPPPNVYFGLQPEDFVVLGRVDIDTPYDYIRNGGDVFVNNIINTPVIMTSQKSFEDNTSSHDIYYKQLVLYGMIGIPNNSEVYYAKLGDLNKHYNTNDSLAYSGNDSEFPIINAFDYTKKLYNPTTCKSLNDLSAGLAFNIDSDFVNSFPFRVHRSLTQPSENIHYNNITTYLANDYYEMPNDRGAITALRSSIKKLYIQQKYSLFIASIKDKLNTVDAVTYLGQGDLFDRTPDEVFTANSKGVIGCTSKWASKVIREGYIVTDQNKGSIYLVDNNGGVKVLSGVGMRRWFFNNLSTEPYYWELHEGTKIPVDNPFTQVGHLIGYDFQYNRLLFTKKMFVFNKPLGGLGTAPSPLYTFDGEYYYKTIDGRVYTLDFHEPADFIEVSHTFSFSLDSSSWVCEHDYYPTAYIESVEDLLSLDESVDIYQHNSKVNKGKYYLGITYPSYVDLIFNGRLDLTKLYQSVTWNSEVIKDNTHTDYFKTIDAIALYTDYQATGIVPLNPNDLSSVRVVEEQWNFNNFRDIVADRTLPIIDEATGAFITPNLNPNKSWFDKSNFISTFLIVRMIMNNANNNAVYINTVNVKSRTSDR